MIGVERYSEEFARELLPLLRKNWRESPSYEEGLEADPNFEMYRRLDQAGVLLCLTLRDDTDARLLGYVVYIVSPSTHHRTITVGRGDVMFIENGHRAKAKEMLNTAEKFLRGRGVRRLGWSVDRDGSLHRLLLSVGFYEDEVVLEKKL
jgi:GNAT superfamily N-acetyltransferase